MIIIAANSRCDIVVATGFPASPSIAVGNAKCPLRGAFGES